MVIQNISDGLILVCGWYNATYSSFFYLVIGLVLWGAKILKYTITTHKENPKEVLRTQSTAIVYTISISLSILFIISKMIILCFGLNIPKIIFFNSSTVSSLLLDALAICAGCAGKWGANLNHYKGEFYIKILGYTILPIVVVAFQSVFTFIYQCCLILCIISYCLGISAYYKHICVAISFVSTIQLAYSYLFYIGILDPPLEFYLFEPWGVSDMVSVYFLQVFFTSLAYCYANRIGVDESSLIADYHEPKFIDKIRYSVLYSITILLLWVCIFLFVGPVGLILMCWMFYSILQDDVYKTRRLNKALLLPTLVISLIIFYLLNLLPSINKQTYLFYQFEHHKIQIVLMNATVCIVGLLYKYSNSIPEEFSISNMLHGGVWTLVFKEMYVFSLAVLFFVGLSDINLLHTGLMILCIVFMLDPKALKRYWVWLVVYTMVMLAVKYTWLAVKPFMLLDSGVLQIIGLSKMNYSLYMGMTYDYLIWVLLLSASIQHTANKLKIETGPVNNILISILVFTYNYFIKFEIWILYSVIIILQFVSSVNILNVVRLAIVAKILFRHLWNTHNKITYNYGEVYKYLVVLQVYSGILLAVRYVYQFLSFIKYSEEYLDLDYVGLGIYNKRELYTAISTDCAFFVTSVFASRNCFRLTKWLGQMKAPESEKKNRHFKKYFSNPFQYLVITTIYCISVFQKLSICMLINIICISMYQISISNHFTKVFWNIYTPKETKWKSRAYLWKYLFFNTGVCLVSSYARFLVDEKFIIDEIYPIIDWAFFLCGFGARSQSVVYNSYPFMIIFVLLIVERHCLEYNIPYSLASKAEGWIKKDFDTKTHQDRNKKSLKRYISFIKALNLFKSISEALIPMLLLLLAFKKLTIVSIFYVLMILFSFCTSKATNPMFLYIVLVILTLFQYILILFNINKFTSDYIPDNNPFPIPWISPFPSANAYFLNLGTNRDQLNSIFYDMLTQVFILIYYFYLYIREKQLLELEKMYDSLEGETEVTDNTFKKKKLSRDIKRVLIFIKKGFYTFARYLVVGITLLFITQSLGLISAFYCVFCLVFIVKENDIYLTKNLDSYSNLLITFLRFLVFDLTLQIFIQLPLFYLNAPNFEKWCLYLGLVKMIGLENSQTEIVSYNHMAILFKIYTFFIVFMVYRMMKSRDYEEYITKDFIEIENKAKNVGYEMAKQFNNERIKMNKFYAESKTRFNEELKKLEETIVYWNKKYINKQKTARKKKSKGSKAEFRASKTQPCVPIPLPSSNQTFKSRLNKFLISLINPHLFKSFVEQISMFTYCRPISSRSEIKNKFQLYSNPANINKQNFKIEELDSDLDSSSDDDDDSSESGLSNMSELNKTTDYWDLNESLEENNVEYEFRWKDYIVIVLYVIASNTEAIVYVCFFLDHWNYASLESIVFPLSVIGYSLIEYPRPPPKYFKHMLIYAEIIFFLKFCLQLEIWNMILGDSLLGNFHDPWKIGLNIAKNTYSQTLFWYVFWDVVVMVALLLHNYYLIKVGLWKETEKDIETLKQAKIRLGILQINKNYNPYKPKKFLDRILPKNKEEKPGKDFYSFTIVIQMIILVYIFCFFTRMDGNSLDISQAIRSNQFQGRMVVSLIVQIALIIIERYFYVNRTSQALKDAHETETNTELLEASRKSLRTPGPRYRSSTNWNFQNKETGNPPKKIEGNRKTLLLDANFQKLIEEDNDTNKKKENERNLPLYVRVTIHIFLVISVHVLVFWYLPMNGNDISYDKLYCKDKNDQDKCNNFEINRFLQGFYFLYMVYLIFAALQIKYSLPSFSKVTFPLLRHPSSYTSIFFKFYRSIPFLFEIRTLMDWIFTTTALSIYQWFKFENIYAQLFITQCEQIKLLSKKHGEKIKYSEKFSHGVCSLFVVVVIILAPLIIFSTLNPIISSNPVTSASLEVKFLYKNRGFRIYSIMTSEEIESISNNDWGSYGFSNVSQLTNSDIRLMQRVLMPIESDVIWDISPSGKTRLCDTIPKANNTINDLTDAMIGIEYSFLRPYPDTYPEVKIKYLIKLHKDDLEAFHATICTGANENIRIPDAFNMIVRLPSQGVKINPIVLDQEGFKNDLVLSLNRKNEVYWWNASTLTPNNIKAGISFFTVSDEHSEITLNFSIITFYISIVYVAGTAIKYITTQSAKNLIMTDMKKTKDLQTLCEGVYISRMIGNIDKEEELYYELIDILRSPEITKMITESSSIKEKKA
jgi:Piezo non-specific cation channel, R-Ras-binding domain